MGLFTSKYSEQDSDLEKALQGVLFSGDIKFHYNAKKNGKDKNYFSPIYLLPMDVHDSVAFGYFVHDRKFVEAPVFFVRKRNFLLKDYYALDVMGNITTLDKTADGGLYLPLVSTDLMVQLGVTENRTFKPHEGAPFATFGIEGAQGLYPIILVSESENGLLCLGFYKKADGDLLTYNHHPNLSSIDQVKELLKAIRIGRGISSGRSAVANINPKNPDMAITPKESLETIADGEIDWQEPKSIVSYLDQFVIGQEEAKMVIAVAFSSYLAKVMTKNEDLQKNNVLLIGPSGVGKTYMISLLAKKASLPMVQTKLTGKSNEGYKGENLSTAFQQIRAATAEEAPYAIIFLDELDKIARSEFGAGYGFNLKIQHEMIGWLEEATVYADTDSHDERKKHTGVNTKNILFVTAGAFQSSEKESSLVSIIRKRLGNGQKQIGFGTKQEPKEKEIEDNDLLHKVRPEDLISYGLQPELVGRLPSLAVLDPLTIEDKVRILTTAKRSTMSNYAQLLMIKGFKLDIEPGVSEVIARCCPEETGARALNSVCNDLFTEILFDPQQYADDKKVIKLTPALAKKLINLYG